jgi:hypothetical protein
MAALTATLINRKYFKCLPPFPNMQDIVLPRRRLSRFGNILIKTPPARGTANRTTPPPLAERVGQGTGIPNLAALRPGYG